MIPIFSVAALLLTTFLSALATFIIKKGVDRYPLRILLTRRILWEGLGLYGLSVLLYIIILRQQELSVVYPLVSTTYIWTTFFSVKYLGEKMSGYKWSALLGIILGVIFIGLGS